MIYGRFISLIMNAMFNLKKQFLLDPLVTFLNHGSFGATPKPVFAEYQRWQRELENQLVEFLGRRFNDLMRTARESLATYLGTSAQNVIYAQNVTVALNIVARSLELGAGDVAGQIPLNLDELGADFYGGNLHNDYLYPYR